MGPTQKYFYGREGQFRHLVKAHQQAGRQCSVFGLIEGPAGIGKSTILQEFLRPLQARRSLSVTVKCDKNDRKPLGTLNKMIVNLVHRLFDQDMAVVAALRQNLSVFNQQSMALLVSRIPELQRVIPNAVSQSIPPEEMFDVHNAFVSASSDLLERLTHTEYPLVIAVDDMQWMDSDSARVLHEILQRSLLTNCFFLLCYRPFSESSNHQAFSLIEFVRRQPNITRLVVEAFSRHTLVTWLNTEYCGVEETVALAEQIHLKTGGIPFDVQHLLDGLRRDGILTESDGLWRVDFQRLQSQPLSDTIAIALENRFDSLAACEQQLLLILALSGKAEQRYLACVLDQPEEVIHDRVQRLLAAAWVRLQGEDICFTHDRLPETLLSQATSKVLQSLQVQVVNRLLAARTASGVETFSYHYELLTHLRASFALHPRDFAIPLLIDLLAHLILIDNQQLPLRFIVDAVNFVFEIGAGDYGTAAQPTILALTLIAQRAALNLADFVNQDRFYDFLKQQTLTDAQYAETHEIKINALVITREPLKAIALGKEVFDRFGLRYRETFGLATYLLKLHRVTRRFERLSLMTIEPSGSIKSSVDDRLVLIANSLAHPAYFIDRAFLRNLALLGASLMLERGAYIQAPFMTMALGYVYKEMGWLGKALKIADVAMRLANEPRFPEFGRNRAYLACYNLISHYRSPLRDNLPKIRTYFDRCFKLGDHEYAALALVYSTYMGFHAGESLTSLAEQAQADTVRMKRLVVSSLADQQLVYHQLIWNLVNAETVHISRFEGPVYVESSEVSAYNREVDHRAHFDLLLCQTMVSLLACRPLEAYRLALRTRLYEDGAANTISPYVQNFMLGVTAACALMRQGGVQGRSSVKQPDFRETLQASLAFSQKAVRYYPEFNDSKHTILTGLQAHVAGDSSAALVRLRRGVELARQARRTMEVVIGLKAMVDILIQTEDTGHVTTYLDELLQATRRWGAKALTNLWTVYYAAWMTHQQEPAPSHWDKAAIYQQLHACGRFVDTIPMLGKALMLRLRARRALLFYSHPVTAKWFYHGEITASGLHLRNLPLNQDQMPHSLQTVREALHTQVPLAVCLNDASLPLFSETAGVSNLLLCLPLPVDGLTRAVIALEAYQISQEDYEDALHAITDVLHQAAPTLVHLFRRDLLSTNEAKYRTLCEQASSGMLQFEQSGEITFINRQMAAWVGLEESRRRHDGGGNIYTATWRSRMGIDPLIDKLDATRNGTYASVEVILDAVNNDEVSTTHLLLTARKNEFNGVDIYASDITAQKQHEHELKKRRDAQVRTARTEQQIAHLSHELRTPIQLILAPAQALMQSASDVPENFRETAGAIVDNAQRLLKVIKDLLWLIQSDNHPVTAVLQPLDLSILVSNLYRQAKPFFESAKRQLLLDVESMRSCLIDGDAKLLERLLLNLLQNAHKYTHTQGITQIRLRHTGDRIRLDIIDDGIGIRASDHKWVFERFTRTASSRLHAEFGLGLGLSVVDDIVKAHDADLELHSEEGQGTAFTLWFTPSHRDSGTDDPDLPLPTTVENIQELAYLSTFVQAPPSEDTHRAVSGLQVLVLEANGQLAQYIENVLSVDFQVTVVRTIAAARDLLLRASFQAALIDLDIAEGNALELIPLCLTMPVEIRPNVLVLTANAAQESIQAAFAAGASDMILKPFELPALRQRLTHLAQLAQTNGELEHMQLRLQRTYRQLHDMQLVLANIESHSQSDP